MRAARAGAAPVRSGIVNGRSRITPSPRWKSSRWATEVREAAPMYRIGRILQLLGLLILPQAIVLELLEKVTLGQSLLIVVAGVGVFMLGMSIYRSGG